MITANEIRERMIETPFRPFRICMTDGRHFDVVNHDMAFVTRNAILVGLYTGKDSIAERTAHWAILHIVRVEELPAKRGRKAKTP